MPAQWLGLIQLLTAAIVAAAIPPAAPAAPAAPALPVTAPAPAPPSPPRQVRALWVDAWHPGFKTPDQVAALVAAAREAGYNTLLVQVRRRGDRYFLQGPEPLAHDPDLAPGFDPLAAVLAAGHAAGMEVHAWVTVLAGWRGDRPPPDPDHLWNRHGPRAAGSDLWVALRRDGQPTEFLDPGHPAVVAHTVDVLTDLVRRYPVDGLHLDYIRYDGSDTGYNPVAVERFNRRHGRTGIPAPDDPAWSAWRRDQVTHLVRRIYIEAAAVRPQARVSAALVAWGAPPGPGQPWEAARPYRQALQDWPAWLAEGILDMAVPMDYFAEPDHRGWFDGWLAWQGSLPGGRPVVAGVGGYLNPPAVVQDQIRRALAAAEWPRQGGGVLAGVALFSYANPFRGAPPVGQGGAGRLPAFGDRAPVPPVPWKDEPTTGHVAGTLTDAAGAPLDGVPVTLAGGGLERRTETGAGGWFGFAHVPPGTYTVAAAGRTWTVHVEAGRVARVPPTAAP